MGTHDVPVIIVSDHPLVRSGLRQLFTPASGVRIAAESPDGFGVADAVARNEAETVVMDLPLRRSSATLTTRAIRTRSPQARVLFLTSFVDDRTQISTALAGAYCCLERDLDPWRLVAAVLGTDQAPVPASHAARAPTERLLGRATRAARGRGVESIARDARLVRLAVQGMTDPELHVALDGPSIDQIRRRLLRSHEWLLGVPAP